MGFFLQQNISIRIGVTHVLQVHRMSLK